MYGYYLAKSLNLSFVDVIKHHITKLQVRLILD